MPTYMNAQKIATKRNALAEMLVDFILQKFAEKLYIEGLITENVEPETQVDFIRDDCSDCFDHFLVLKLSHTAPYQNRTLELWGQTTCYKGNPSGKPESNKTYEIRETLAEALTLRKWLKRENKFFRTFHFTLGPANYTYGWFKTAKENAFDLSLYPTTENGVDIFDLILSLADGITYQYEFTEKLESIMEDADSVLYRYINNAIQSLYEYFIQGIPVCEMADLQAELLQSIDEHTAEICSNCIDESHNSGMNIKGRAVSLLSGCEIDDPVLMATLQRLLNNNPFLDEALTALSDWDNWANEAFNIPEINENLHSYISALWSNSTTKKYVIRRLLIRSYTNHGINYIQDLDIDGLDEHNLYSGTPSDEQLARITDYLMPLYITNGFNTTGKLCGVLSGHSAKNIVNSSLKFEGINGTNLKPSFYYLEEFLKPEYDLRSFSETSLQSPIAYYNSFAPDLTVKPYDNLKVICHHDSNRVIAIVKGKFFRKQEFPRRAKEEAYVGITTKYDLVGDDFKLAYPGLPLIMFIDMQDNWTPPAFALRRLINYGWHPFFELEKLKRFLDSLSRGE